MVSHTLLALSVEHGGRVIFQVRCDDLLVLASNHLQIRDLLLILDVPLLSLLLFPSYLGLLSGSVAG